jgi:hypothetical protein
MAQKIAGVAFLTVGGVQMRLRGNFTVSHSMVERTMLAGQDGIHGYQELPRVPFIEADISTTPDFDITALDGQVDVTVLAQLADGWYYQMTDSICKAGLEQTTRDGQARVRWEGINVNTWQGAAATVQAPWGTANPQA